VKKILHALRCRKRADNGCVERNSEGEDCGPMHPAAVLRKQRGNEHDLQEQADVNPDDANAGNIAIVFSVVVKSSGSNIIVIVVVAVVVVVALNALAPVSLGKPKSMGIRVLGT